MRRVCCAGSGRELVLAGMVLVAAACDAPTTDPLDPLAGIAQIAFDSAAKRVYPVGATVALDSLAFAVPTAGGVSQLPPEGLTWTVSDASVVQLNGSTVSANGAGIAYLIVSYRETRDSLALQVVERYDVTAVASLQGLVETVYGVSALGWVAYSVRVGLTATYHLWRNGVDETPADCQVRGVNDLGQILCRTASGAVELIQGANRSALADLQGSSWIGLNSAGGVAASRSDSMFFRLASGDSYRVRVNTLCFCFLPFLPGGPNTSGDVVLTNTGGNYLNSAIWRPIEGGARNISPVGRHSAVYGMNDLRTIVGYTENPTGSNQQRPIIWRYDGSVWRAAAVAVDVTGKANHINDSDLAVGVMGPLATGFLWSGKVLGPPVPLDDLLTDDLWTIKEAFRISSDGRIVARATLKSSGATSLVLLTPAGIS